MTNEKYEPQLNTDSQMESIDEITYETEQNSLMENESFEENQQIDLLDDFIFTYCGE